MAPPPRPLQPPDAPDDFGDYAFDTSPFWGPVAIIILLLLRRWRRRKEARRLWGVAILVTSMSKRMVANVTRRHQQRALRRWRSAALVVNAPKRMLSQVDDTFKRMLQADLANVKLGDLFVHPKDIETSKDILRRVLISEPYCTCLMREFVLFATPVLSEPGWRLEMRLEADSAQGWLALSGDLVLRGSSSTSAAKDKAVKRGKDVFKAITGSSKTSADESFSLSRYFEAIACTAVLCDSQGRPPYKKQRFEKLLVDWLDGVLVPHAAEHRSEFEDVLPPLRKKASGDVDLQAALDELLYDVQEPLFESYKETPRTEEGRQCPPGVSLPRFVEMAELLRPELLEASMVQQYRQVAKAAFVRALPRTELHRNPNALRLLQLPTFREATLRLAFVSVNLHVHLASASENTLSIELLRKPARLGARQINTLGAVLQRALPVPPKPRAAKMSATPASASAAAPAPAPAPSPAPAPVPAPAFDGGATMRVSNPDREMLRLALGPRQQAPKGTPRRVASARAPPSASSRDQVQARARGSPSSAREPRLKEERRSVML